MVAHDVFISYAHVDGVHVEPLERALIAAGLRVFRDTTTIPLFASITRSVAQALESSKALLAFYSSRYPLHRACQWELTAAYLAAQSEGGTSLQEGAGDPRRRVFVINPEPSFDHIDPWELRDARTLPAWDGSRAALDAVVDTVVARVAEIQQPFGAISPGPSPAWHGGRGVAATRFTGRTRQMWALHSALSQRERALNTGHAGPTHVQLRGMGGIGKSLLAEEYALRFGRAYPGGVFWLSSQLGQGRSDGRSGGALDLEAFELARVATFRDLAASLGVQTRDMGDDVVKRVLERRLTRAALPYLWIVDDLPARLPERARRRWLAPTDLGTTLITTQDRTRDGLGETIDLDVLDDASAYELLTSRAKPATPDDEVAARGLVADLGNHALALDVAGGALAALAGGETFTSFRKTIANPERDVLPFLKDLGGELPNQAQRNIVATLFRGYGLLDRGRDFLRLASILAHDVIPPDLVEAVLSELGEREPFAGARAADEAVVHSFADRADAARGGWVVHTLHARTAAFHDPDPRRRLSVRQAAIVALTGILTEATENDRNAKVLTHAAHARHALGDAVVTMDEARLLAAIGAHDQNLGLYDSAGQAIERALACVRGLTGDDDPDVLHFMSALAWTQRLRGHLQKAHDALVEIVAKQRASFGDDDERTQISCHLLADTLRALGKLMDAHREYEQLVETRSRLLGREDAKTLRAIAGFAAVLRDEADLVEARRLEEHVRDVRLKTLGPNDPDTILAKNELAETLRASGELARARTLGEEVLVAWTELWGPEHPQTLTAMCNLAFTLWEFGDAVSMARARELEERVVRLRSQVLGENHPDTLLALNNLGSTLRKLGDAAGAREKHTRALQGRQRALGPDHPDTLQSMNNLALALIDLGRDGLRPARDLQKAVLAGRLNAYAAGHPEILKAASNLLATLIALGDQDAAREVMSKHITPLLERPAETLGPTAAEIRAQWLAFYRSQRS